MNKIKKNKLISALFLAISFFLVFSLFSLNAQANSLNGRILLQVQENGEAWYVNPLNSRRYYLGRPADAFSLMRSLGLGVKNSDINSFLKAKAPDRLSGRILLQVEDKGQAFYVNPLDLKLYYLGRPDDAFSLMRRMGLGISNSDLSKIAIAENTNIPVYGLLEQKFSFRYKNNNYELKQNLYKNLYSDYKNLPKTYSYLSSEKPDNLRDSFYSLFFKVLNGDNSLNELIDKSRNLAKPLNLSEDEFINFIISLLQHIPYDSEKVAASGLNNNPYYPYETLYLNRGVCSDKTFLTVAVLRHLGYGAAILDFPESNHSAAGIKCPLEYSVNSSGYCFIETTNYFPISVVPKNINNGRAGEGSSKLDNLSAASHLGKMEIYQKSSGKTYYGAFDVFKMAQDINDLDYLIKDIYKEVEIILADIDRLEIEVANLKTEMDSYLNAGLTSKYNALVPTYNNSVENYNNLLANYREKIGEYNQKIELYNSLIKDFYQN